jgi:hypothetical protein
MIIQNKTLNKETEQEKKKTWQRMNLTEKEGMILKERTIVRK